MNAAPALTTIASALTFGAHFGLIATVGIMAALGVALRLVMGI